MLQVAAAVDVAIFAALAAFQAALAAGVPWGEAAWGGRQRVLPAGLRVASGVAVLFWLTVALATAARGDLFTIVDRDVPGAAFWALAGLLAIGTIMNGLSRSPKERYIWTPAAGVACVLTLVVAWQG